MISEQCLPLRMEYVLNFKQILELIIVCKMLCKQSKCFLLNSSLLHKLLTLTLLTKCQRALWLKYNRSPLRAVFLITMHYNLCAFWSLRSREDEEVKMNSYIKWLSESARIVNFYYIRSIKRQLTGAHQVTPPAITSFRAQNCSVL